MKTKFFAIAAIAATALFASCDNEDNNPPAAEEGQPTTMSVIINTPAEAGTRTTADENASEDESEVNTVDIFIYAGTGNFLSHTHLAANEFTQITSSSEADKYKAKAKIKTTTGEKIVFAGVNLPAGMVTSLQNKPAAELMETARTMGRDDLYSSAGFTMFSTHGERRTFVADDNAAANQVDLTVQRLVAKVTVETHTDINVESATGTLGDLKFAIDNFNKKIFLVQGIAPHKDPNWAHTDYSATDFLAVTTNTYKNILSRKLNANPEISDYEPDYAAENTSENKWKEEITRAIVRGTFIPEKITTSADGATVVTNPQPATVRTFYAVTPSTGSGTSYFTDENLAKDFANANSASIDTYTNGFCYWNIWLNKNPGNAKNKWDVLRNEYYKCVITRIVAPGLPAIDIPDPEVTPDDEANITATIDILFWKMRDSNYEL